MNIELPDNLDLNNPEFQNVWNLIQHTHQSVFLTGKAGTGKSTFLKYICANTKKTHVVLAPTGIAAVNVGGQTLHSFFKIPFKPLLPDDPDFSTKMIRKTQRYSKDKIQLLKELELIIIDEISMVRADIIDFIDKILRVFSNNMREPFGGKQLLFVGDIFQLEPVVTRDMREILGRVYKQFFFFNATVFSQLGLIPIELRKIYRQTDNEFISLLDRVRIGRVSRFDMVQLNSRCNPNHADSDEFSITLATRRETVNSINDEHMDALKTEEFVFTGEIEGNFPENDLPTAYELQLKVGAQVIFIRNDKDCRWVNGTIGKIHALGTKVSVVLEDGEIVMVEPELWENIQYSYDEEKRVVVENVLGSFKQLPIKPAWALTVHKSQGLTFNNVIIDFAGGAFSSGQTYVALSRCTSLEGITLLKPMSERDIIVNTAVVEFSRHFNNQSAVNDAMNYAKANDLYRRANHAFEHNEFADCIKCFAEAMKINNVIQSPVAQRLIVKKFHKFSKIVKEIDRLNNVIESQLETLKELALEYTAMGNQSMGYAGVAAEDSVSYGKKNKLDDIALKSAMANFNKALRICPDCYQAMEGKARLLEVIDEVEAAEDELKKALKLKPDYYEAHISLAILYRNQKDYPEAIKSFKRAIRSDKKRPEPHEALAEIYDKLGLEDLAETQIAMAKKLRTTSTKKRKKTK